MSDQKMEKIRVPQDIIIQLDKSGYWILYNVFAHKTLAVCENTLLLLTRLQQDKSINEIEKELSGKSFSLRVIGTFSNYDGLLADPTKRIRNADRWPKEASCNITDAINLLTENYILIVDENKYENTLNLKSSLLDTNNVGNFHQQLGQHLLLERRTDPGEWWVNQKFNSQLNGLQDTLYKAIQENFLKSFFSSRFNSSHKILDIGCGVGYYSNMMSQTGASVLGIDPNPKYIQIAAKNFENNATFKVSQIGEHVDDLKWIETRSHDFIFMSDALLFYFVSPDPKQNASISLLFSEIKRILKPNGRFFSMEPHGVFWLRPWLGEENRPFTVITEHRNKLYNVAPNYYELIKAYTQESFTIKDMKELYADEDFIGKDNRAGVFANKFPLWWFFELAPGQ